MNAAELAAVLRRRAADEGFDAVGIAAAMPLDRDGQALEAWLGAGRHAGMGWMARDPARRSDPRELLPGCRSVVALAMNYWPGPEPSASPPRYARVARYARGRDYHKVLGVRLRRLAEWLATVSGAPARAFVDTAPVLERAWAERAGLGWIGKNANLLTRDMGSWLLLGELLAVAELAPDPGPHADFCGSCTACLDACPTAAIIAPAQVDANLCIAYWNIEHRGAIPDERREGLGDWIFGCDVCQEVCPWNERFARPAAGDPFTRRDDLAGLDPLELLSMDEARFRERFSGTALMRARWDGMRRNACVVLGNRRDPAAVPALARALGDPDPLVRGHAAWALGRIGGEAARTALRQAEASEPAGEALAEIRAALVR